PSCIIFPGELIAKIKSAFCASSAHIQLAASRCAFKLSFIGRSSNKGVINGPNVEQKVGYTFNFLFIKLFNALATKVEPTSSAPGYTITFDSKRFFRIFE